MLRKALLTSFTRSVGLVIPCYSIAVYQPKGFDYPKVESFDIRLQSSGLWVRPRLFDGHTDTPLEAYADVLTNLFESRNQTTWQELEDLPDYAALCCWCPYDKAAQRQLREHGSFVCHSAVVANILRSVDVEVVFDRDRQEMVTFDER